MLRDNGFRYYDFSDQFTDTSGFADLVHLKRKAYADFSAAVADSITSGR
jgi:poly-D-alanine transfer protein DltD